MELEPPVMELEPPAKKDLVSPVTELAAPTRDLASPTSESPFSEGPQEFGPGAAGGPAGLGGAGCPEVLAAPAWPGTPPPPSSQTSRPGRAPRGVFLLTVTHLQPPTWIPRARHLVLQLNPPRTGTETPEQEEEEEQEPGGLPRMSPAPW